MIILFFFLIFLLLSFFFLTHTHTHIQRERERNTYKTLSTFNTNDVDQNGTNLFSFVCAVEGGREGPEVQQRAAMGCFCLADALRGRVNCPETVQQTRRGNQVNAFSSRYLSEPSGDLDHFKYLKIPS